MKKITTLPLLLVMALAACDDHDNSPEPATKQLRAQSMSYGDFHYRILHYDNNNNVSTLITGMLVDGDSVKNTHQCVYEGNKIKKMDVGDFTLEYLYENGNISETREYRANALIAAHVYMYDQNNRVISWAVLHPEGDQMVPFSKTGYTYYSDGNLATQKQYVYDETGYRLINTVFFEDFDDKQNSSTRFMIDIYNIYDQKFKNNARRWHLVNENGTTADEHFQFEYNAQGYVTKSTPAGGASTIYRYTEY